MGAAQTLHATALLIDKDRQIAPGAGAQIAGQAAQLIGSFDVTGEKNEAKGLAIGEKRRFFAPQSGPFAAKDGGGPGLRDHLWVTGMQVAFSARRALQNRRASSSSAKPSARRR